MSQSLPRSVLVIGDGPVGCFMADLLAKRLSVTLVTKRAGKLKLSEKISRLPAEQLSSAKADWVFVCVKAYDVESVLSAISCDAKARAHTFLVSNGLGIFELAAKLLDRRQGLFRLLLNFGMRFDSEGRVLVSGEPHCLLAGEVPEEVRAAHEVLARLGFLVSPLHDPKAAEWQKSLVNACVNTICTLAEQDNGALLRDAEFNKLARLVMDEVRAVAGSCGVDLSQTANEEVLASISAHAGNINSTLEGWRRSQRSDLRCLVKPILEAAHKNKVAAPVLFRLYSKLEVKFTS